MIETLAAIGATFLLLCLILAGLALAEHTRKADVDNPRRLALACAEPHPMRPDLLCSRLCGHGGMHHGDGDTTWDDGWAVAGEAS